MLRRHFFSTSPLQNACCIPSSLCCSLRHFATQDPKKFQRLRKCIASGGNGLRGRSKYSYDFEKRIRLIAADSRQCVAWPLRSEGNNDSSLTFDPTTTIVTDVVTKEELELRRMLRPHPMPIYYLEEQNEEVQLQNAVDDEQENNTAITFLSRSSLFNGEKRRRLQKDGDTNCIEVTLEKQEEDTKAASENNKNETSSFLIKTHLIQVIEPDVRDISFQRMEAQIELVTAFRNILMEFFEVACPSKNNNKVDFLINEKPRYSTLRVPPLSLAYHNGKFDEGVMEKMHHASLIQAFHRCSRDVKDWFALHQDDLTVELFVPRSMIESFEKAFYESEAWPTPASQLIPEKLAMYPGLQMPASLLENAPGFIGQREEIKALALPYEERIEKLKMIEEEKFQERLKLIQEGGKLDDEQLVLLELEAGVHSSQQQGSEDGIKIVPTKDSSKNIFR